MNEHYQSAERQTKNKSFWNATDRGPSRVESSKKTISLLFLFFSFMPHKTKHVVVNNEKKKIAFILAIIIFARLCGSYTASYTVVFTVRFENHVNALAVDLVSVISCSIYCTRFIRLFSLIFTNEMKQRSNVSSRAAELRLTGRLVSLDADSHR